ncbi:MAG TPA: TonB family protein [Blastocatellia bacterium]|nr:TonB family protein [Blastocatellia bacterium]
MLANPPADPMAARHHISIAWPLDRLFENSRRGAVVGFLMPHLAKLRPIIDFYNPMTRRQFCPLFTYQYAHRTASNLAATVAALHAGSYVIGDVNESNILVSETALVALIDTDSFQVRGPDGTVYRCLVGRPEFTPPELQGKSLSKLDRRSEHDLFGLAVIIFQLLMEGSHPFLGVFRGRGEPPPLEQRIAAGHFPYAVRRQVPFKPNPNAPPFDLLPTDLRDLFVRCFEDGHQHPLARPTAETWHAALNEAERALITCRRNLQHFYGNHLSQCPWCARTNQLAGRDPFPSAQAVRQGAHHRPLKTAPSALPRPAPVVAAPVTRPMSPYRPPIRRSFPRPGKPLFRLAAAIAAVALFLLLWTPVTQFVSHLLARIKAAVTTTEAPATQAKVPSSPPRVPPPRHTPAPATNANLNLPPALAVLLLYAQTNGVTVMINGAFQGAVSSGRPQRIRLAPGDYVVQASKPGFKPWERVVRLAANDQETLTIEMESAGPSVQEQVSRQLELAAQYLRQQQFDEALAACNEGLQYDPGNRTLLEARANITRLKEEHLQAERRRQERQEEERRQRDREAMPPQPPPPEVVQPPVLIRKIVPTYPEVARTMRVTGKVTVVVSISETGEVVSARALSGPPLLYQAALDAAKRWKYRPARRGNQPVAATQTISFDFTL